MRIAILYNTQPACVTEHGVYVPGLTGGYHYQSPRSIEEWLRLDNVHIEYVATPMGDMCPSGVLPQTLWILVKDSPQKTDK